MLVSRDDAATETSEISTFVNQFITQQYSQFTILTLVVYEALLTYNEEVEFFWGTSLAHPITMIFLVNRYVSMFGAIAIVFWNFYNMSATTCQFTLWADHICGAITMTAVEYVLLIRVLALYSGRRRFTVCLVTAFCLTAAAKFGFSIYGSIAQKASPALIAEGHSLCNVESIPPVIISFINWSIPLAYSVILMILAVAQAARYWKGTAGLTGSTLIMVLARDQVVYFAFVLSCSLCNILQIKVPISNLTIAYFIQTGGSPYILSILSARMLFNLKKAAKHGFNTGTNYRPKTLTMMEFELREAAPIQSTNLSTQIPDPYASRSPSGYS